MLKRGFLRREKEEPKQGRSIKMASSIMLYLGVIILIVSLGYLLVNIERVDDILVTSTVFILAGIFLIVMSHMIKWIFR